MHEIITLLEDEKEVTAPSTSVTLIPDPEEPYSDEDSEEEEDTGAGLGTPFFYVLNARFFSVLF